MEYLSYMVAGETRMLLWYYRQKREFDVHRCTA
jgi:hypothetical protein